MSHRVKKKVWMCRLPNRLLFDQIVKKIKIFGNNKISLILTKDLENSNCIKYIDVIYHYI